jgi:hypothetical protein
MRHSLIFSALSGIFLLVAAPVLGQSSPLTWQWPNTDFSKASVDLNEIRSGGPGKDGIPAVDNPAFLPVSEEERIADREPVMTLELDGETPRAYPIRYLMWHEIANDEVGGIPVTVTFCPLCNSGVIFDGRLDGEVLTFGVTGNLRNSDMVMYDRQTESWWQQFVGEAIVGEMTGKVLTKLPGWMESWAEFKTRNPNGLVMDEPGFPRDYGANPYAGYDSSSRPFLYSGEPPPHGIPALARVVVVGATAWPLSRFKDKSEIVEQGVRISWTAGTASALDGRDIGQSRDVGSIRVQDAESGEDLPHDVAFAFAFHAFFPQGNWMLGGS